MRQVLDDVAQVAFREELDQVLRHGAFPFGPLDDTGFRDERDGPVLVHQADCLFVFTLDDAGEHPALVGRQQGGLEALGDLGAGLHDGFEQVAMVLLLADRTEVRADLAARGADANGPVSP